MRLSRCCLMAFALLTLDCFPGGRTLPYQNPKFPLEKRLDDLEARMTTEDKRAVLAGHSVQRLGIPALQPSSIQGKTIRPTPTALAATWNTELMGKTAQGIADEALSAGRKLIAGRDPREFGPDPWLSSRMTVAWVSGLQGEGVVAALRGFGDGYSTLDDRTRNEVLLAPLRAAVEEAGLWSVELPTADREPLLNMLDNIWGFKGFVLNANEGDDALGRRLRALFAIGAFDPSLPASADDVVNKRNVQTAFDQSFVLLRNEGNILPLSPTLPSIAFIGGRLPQMPPQSAYASGDSIPAAADLARRSVAAVVFSGNADLIRAVAAQNRNTVMVLDGAALASAGKWANLAPAEIVTWGSRDIGRVLFGEVSPSGKLPFAVEPLFPFGAGLSYTAFTYSNLKIFPQTPRYGEIVQVALEVKNTGSHAGAEVVEIYVHQQTPAVGGPLPKLKAFGRVELKAGEARLVSFELDRRAMSFYDPAAKTWATEPGVFDVSVGSSSRDIRARGSFQLFR